MAPPGWKGRASRLVDAEGRGDGPPCDGGVLVVTAIVAGVLMAEREVHFVHLESRLGDLEHRLGQERAGTPRPLAGSR